MLLAIESYIIVKIIGRVCQQRISFQMERPLTCWVERSLRSLLIMERRLSKLWTAVENGSHGQRESEVTSCSAGGRRADDEGGNGHAQSPPQRTNNPLAIYPAEVEGKIVQRTVKTRGKEKRKRRLKQKLVSYPEYLPRPAVRTCELVP